MTSPETERPGALTRGSATGVGVASVVAAASSYGVILIAAWTLEPARNADFLAFWSLLFFSFGMLAGIQNETTRSVRSAYDGAVGRAPGAPVLPLALAIGAALGLLLVATSAWWAAPVLGEREPLIIAVLALAVVAFAGQVALAGSLGGAGRWSVFAVLVGSEATARLALVALAAVAGAAIAGLEVAAAAAAGTWLLVLAASPAARRAAGARADVTTWPFLRRSGAAIVAAASSAALVVGFPVLLRVTSTPAEYALSAPLLIAVSLTRAPLMIPLGAYQGVAITHFLTHRDRGIAAIRPIALAVLGAGALGALLAWLVGPWLMATLIRSDYRVDGAVLAGLTFAAALLALLTLTGAAVLALDRHAAYTAGWIAATLVSTIILLLPLPVELRAVLSLGVGPVVGVVVHLVAASRAPLIGR
ncbi:hypothetical protein [Cellulomonas sp. Root137]|uniref:hypothetical protein n=1 Tax=Cellulomonas sp. Root137 TaxID=1736459 RepID=UPI0006FE1560|nr:hypothetical protein [Cellulomonas sp. Root137]KQY47495.1 hypothetical protein ASD18_09275 [Cellulomonas sp. Root137]